MGTVIWVNGPVVRADTTQQAHMMEMVFVGKERLIGEVIRLRGAEAVIQVYEDTTGLKAGMPVFGTGAPLSVELGPGLVSTIYDGLQRPLARFIERSGPWIDRGGHFPALDRTRRWRFSPTAPVATMVKGGTILGTVQETLLITHRIMVPPRLEGRLSWLAPEGEYTVDEPIARLHTRSGEITVTMSSRWPVRMARPVRRRLRPSRPLLTGQRIIDALFPLAKGGTAMIPGGFGTGKTVMQHQLAKWSDADLIVYIGCGERGNEMTNVLREFPHLEDPKSGHPLMERTILVANTSNMPVAAREASIYTGLTLAEYYRDMGLDVAVMADSTSRWAEALREIAGRLEEMPAEEGFPAYLGTRLAEFYERAGLVQTLSGEQGSLSIIGAVSPPGGDLSEPVTQQTRRFVRCFWALDRELASARHFPAIQPVDSYSEYAQDLITWWIDQEPDWARFREQVVDLLRRDRRLQQLVKLVGEEALPDEQKLALHGARLWREAFLQQSAFEAVDRYTTTRKQLAMMRVLHHWYHQASELIKRHIPFYRLAELPVNERIMRMKLIPNEEVDTILQLIPTITAEMDALARSMQV
ncbi:MAG: V-type ATP synthase subunit A [Nitrospirae bacterium]|nr:MAG: V-type ATP synthase subunit A [Nitrospirota bacterium]